MTENRTFRDATLHIKNTGAMTVNVYKLTSINYLLSILIASIIREIRLSKSALEWHFHVEMSNSTPTHTFLCPVVCTLWLLV